MAGLIQGGKVKLLAVSTKEPLAQFPGVPTVDTSGLPGFFFDSWATIVAPHGTPRPIVDRLHQSVVKALAAADVKAQLAPLGMTLRGIGPDEFGAATRGNFDLYRQLIHDGNIQSN